MAENPKLTINPIIIPTGRDNKNKNKVNITVIFRFKYTEQDPDINDFLKRWPKKLKNIWKEFGLQINGEKDSFKFTPSSAQPDEGLWDKIYKPPTNKSIEDIIVEDKRYSQAYQNAVPTPQNKKNTISHFTTDFEPKDSVNLTPKMQAFDSFFENGETNKEQLIEAVENVSKILSSSQNRQLPKIPLLKTINDEKTKLESEITDLESAANNKTGDDEALKARLKVLKDDQKLQAEAFANAVRTEEGEEENHRKKSFAHVYARCSQYPGLMEKLGFILKGSITLLDSTELEHTSYICFSTTKHSNPKEQLFLPLVKSIKHEAIATCLNKQFFPIVSKQYAENYKEIEYEVSQYDPMMTAMNLAAGVMKKSASNALYVTQTSKKILVYPNPHDLEAITGFPAKKFLYAEQLIDGVKISISKDLSPYTSLCSRNCKLYIAEKENNTGKWPPEKSPKEKWEKESALISSATTAVPTPLVGQLLERKKISFNKEPTTKKITFRIPDELSPRSVIIEQGANSIELNIESQKYIPNASLLTSFVNSLDNNDSEEITAHEINLLNAVFKSCPNTNESPQLSPIFFPYSVRVIGKDENFSGSHEFNSTDFTELTAIHRPFIEEPDIYFGSQIKKVGESTNLQLTNDVARVVPSQNFDVAEKLEIFPLFKFLVSENYSEVRIVLSQILGVQREFSYLCASHGNTMPTSSWSSEDTALHTIEGQRRHLALTPTETSLVSTATADDLRALNGRPHLCCATNLPQAPLALAHLAPESSDAVLKSTISSLTINKVSNSFSCITSTLGGRPNLIRGIFKKIEYVLEGIAGPEGNLKKSGKNITVGEDDNELSFTLLNESELPELDMGYATRITLKKEEQDNISWVNARKLSTVGSTANVLNLPPIVKALKKKATVSAVITLQTSNGQLTEILIPDTLWKKIDLMKDSSWLNPFTKANGEDVKHKEISINDFCEVIVDSSGDVHTAKAWPRNPYGTISNSLLVFPSGDSLEIAESDSKNLTSFFKLTETSKGLLELQNLTSPPEQYWLTEVTSATRDPDHLQPEYSFDLRVSLSDNATWTTTTFKDVPSNKILHRSAGVEAHGHLTDLEIGDMLLCQPKFSDNGRISIDPQTNPQKSLKSFLIGKTSKLDKEQAILSKLQDGIVELSAITITTPAGSHRTVWLPDSTLDSLTTTQYLFSAAPVILAKSITKYQHSRDADKIITPMMEPNRPTTAEPVRLHQTRNLIRYDGTSPVCENESTPDPTDDFKDLITPGDIKIDSTPAVKTPHLRYGSRFRFQIEQSYGDGEACHEDVFKPKQTNECLFRNPYAPNNPLVAFYNKNAENAEDLEYIVGKKGVEEHPNHLIVATDLVNGKYYETDKENATNELHLCPPPAPYQTLYHSGVFNSLFDNWGKEEGEIFQNFIQSQETHFLNHELGQRLKPSNYNNKLNKKYRFPYLTDPRFCPIRVSLVGINQPDEFPSPADQSQYLSYWDQRDPKRFSPLKKKAPSLTKHNSAESIFSVSNHEAYEDSKLKSAHISLEEDTSNSNYRKIKYSTTNNGDLPPGTDAKILIQSAWPEANKASQKIKINEEESTYSFNDTFLEDPLDPISIRATHAVNMPLTAPDAPEIELLEQRKAGDTKAHLKLTTRVEPHTTGKVTSTLYWNEYHDQSVGLQKNDPQIDIILGNDNRLKGFSIVAPGTGCGELCDVLVKKTDAEENTTAVAYDLVAETKQGQLTAVHIRSEHGETPGYVKNPTSYEFKVRTRPPLINTASATAMLQESSISGDKSYTLEAEVTDRGMGYHTPPYGVLANPPANLPAPEIVTAIDYHGRVTKLSIKIPDGLQTRYASYYKNKRLQVTFYTHSAVGPELYVAPPQSDRPNADNKEKAIFPDFTLDLGHTSATEITATVQAESRFKELISSRFGNAIKLHALNSPISKTPIEIKATSKPPEIKLHHTTHAFRWIVNGKHRNLTSPTPYWNGRDKMEIKRSAYVRFYINRTSSKGWWDPAIVLYRPEGVSNSIKYDTQDETLIDVPEAYRSFCSTWAFDPLYGTSDFPALSVSHLRDTQDHHPSVFLATEHSDLSQQVYVVPISKHFDASSSSWYFDLGFNIPDVDINNHKETKPTLEPSTLPFLHPVLTNFQPSAVGRQEISTVLESEQKINLLGDHQVTLNKDGTHVSIKVEGPFPYSCNQGDDQAYPKIELKIQIVTKPQGIDEIVAGEEKWTYSSLRKELEFKDRVFNLKIPLGSWQRLLTPSQPDAPGSDSPASRSNPENKAKLAKSKKATEGNKEASTQKDNPDPNTSETVIINHYLVIKEIHHYNPSQQKHKSNHEKFVCEIKLSPQ